MPSVHTLLEQSRVIEGKPGHLRLQSNFLQNLQHIRTMKLWSQTDKYMGILNMQLDLATAFQT